MAVLAWLGMMMKGEQESSTSYGSTAASCPGVRGHQQAVSSANIHPQKQKASPCLWCDQRRRWLEGRGSQGLLAGAACGLSPSEGPQHVVEEEEYWSLTCTETLHVFSGCCSQKWAIS